MENIFDSEKKNFKLEIKPGHAMRLTLFIQGLIGSFPAKFPPSNYMKSVEKGCQLLEHELRAYFNTHSCVINSCILFTFIYFIPTKFWAQIFQLTSFLVFQTTYLQLLRDILSHHCGHVVGNLALSWCSELKPSSLYVPPTYCWWKKSQTTTWDV